LKRGKIASFLYIFIIASFLIGCNKSDKINTTPLALPNESNSLSLEETKWEGLFIIDSEAYPIDFDFISDKYVNIIHYSIDNKYQEIDNDVSSDTHEYSIKGNSITIYNLSKYLLYSMDGVLRGKIRNNKIQWNGYVDFSISKKHGDNLFINTTWQGTDDYKVNYGYQLDGIINQVQFRNVGLKFIQNNVVLIGMSWYDISGCIVSYFTHSSLYANYSFSDNILIINFDKPQEIFEETIKTIYGKYHEDSIDLGIGGYNIPLNKSQCNEIYLF
jgi:hypothetical protein